jgi:hypothetical protein
MCRAKELSAPLYVKNYLFQSQVIFYFILCGKYHSLTVKTETSEMTFLHNLRSIYFFSVPEKSSVNNIKALHKSACFEKVCHSQEWGKNCYQNNSLTVLLILVVQKAEQDLCT